MRGELNARQHRRKKKENKINLDLHEAKSEKKARSIAILCWRNNRDSKALLLSLTASPQKEKKNEIKTSSEKEKKNTFEKEDHQ